ncbi:hypothetical protein OPQ81_003949 [Rhizoctonia solani]|nr:hypothetical protein OPQ81_003899 [Rhizoctonia solani]KAJ1308234.1 hypothetical protein OPQ81_003949 [Rhizoctonia solani]
MSHLEKRSAWASSKLSEKSVNEKGFTRQGAQSGSNQPPPALRKIPSAVLSGTQLLLFRVRLPFHRLHRMNFAEMVVSTGYLVALLIWSFINSRGLTVGLWANRVAHLATSQTPLVVALAGKNNIVTLLTGISYEKVVHALY